MPEKNICPQCNLEGTLRLTLGTTAKFDEFDLDQQTFNYWQEPRDSIPVIDQVWCINCEHQWSQEEFFALKIGE